MPNTLTHLTTSVDEDSPTITIVPATPLPDATFASAQDTASSDAAPNSLAAAASADPATDDPHTPIPLALQHVAAHHDARWAVLRRTLYAQRAPDVAAEWVRVVAAARKSLEERGCEGAVREGGAGVD
ncbi:hypothetical protein PsYK624_150870 [Phanerochaete sordida]|uniref:Uncharacterized protein n=1 Tax=Phanerochaete sordida TaxID=48140 RepID=A0A9P3GSR9_9APHY|nr:hypothetical protein PsYK624_150870 [Phanerochaete sordida]